MYFYAEKFPLRGWQLPYITNFQINETSPKTIAGEKFLIIWIGVNIFNKKKTVFVDYIDHNELLLFFINLDVLNTFIKRASTFRRASTKEMRRKIHHNECLFNR